MGFFESLPKIFQVPIINNYFCEETNQAVKPLKRQWTRRSEKETPNRKRSSRQKSKHILEIFPKNSNGAFKARAQVY